MHAIAEMIESQQCVRVKVCALSSPAHLISGRIGQSYSATGQQQSSWSEKLDLWFWLSENEAENKLNKHEVEWINI